MFGNSGQYALSSSIGKTAGYHDNLGYTENSDVKQNYGNVQYTVNTEEIKSNGICMSEREPGPYRGMGKDELLAFSSQPFWRRLRTIVLAIVLIGWLALVIAVVALVLVYPRCRDPATRSWWQTEAVYRIYVPSFKDSNNDGIGDLQGIKSKLDYIKELGFGVISLSPFYKVNDTVSNFTHGNEMAITNHTSIYEPFGTLSDFEALVNAVHEKGMYVILDFIPNHTGDRHPWFVESAYSTDITRKNFYVWEEALPNNWKSQYNGSAWKYNQQRNKFFFHQYRHETPDLNLRSASVQKELEDILNFWLDLGVDGFNVRNAAFLFEDFDLRNETAKANSDYYDDTAHVYTRSLPETYDILEKWNSFIRAHNKTTTEKLIMAGLEGGLDATRLYGTCDFIGLQMPLNVLNADHYCNGTCITNYVDSWLKKVPNGKWANWMTGDENTRRFSTKFNSSLIKPLITLIFLLPGTPIILYGDEINIVDRRGNNNNAPWVRSQPMRQIMKWDNTTNGGFCNDSCSPWSHIGDNPHHDGSLLTLLKDLKQLRSQKSFKIGDYFAALRDQYVISFVREFDGETGYLVAINLGPNTETRDFTKSHDTIPPEEAVVVLTNGFSYSVEDKVTPNSLELGPFGYVVVSWDYVAKEL